METWEKQLRQQLEEKAGSDWEASLKEELKNVKLPKRTAKTYSHKYFIIFVLLCANLFLYNQKTNGAWITYFQSRLAPQTQGPFRPQPRPNQSQPDYSPQLSKIKSEISKIAEDTKANKEELEKMKERWLVESHRQTLLGILHNENFQIIISKQNPKEIMLLNRDWTINKMPSHLQLTPEDLEYLKRHVKN